MLASNRAIWDLLANWTEIDKQMKAAKEPQDAAALLGERNEIGRQIDAKLVQYEALKKREGRIDDVQPAFVDAVAAAIKSADIVSSRYARLAIDRVLERAIQDDNKGAPEPLKLGPSETFAADLAFLHQCDDAIALDTIAVQIEHGVPTVDVKINGKTAAMIWDSGASSVSLSAETAAAMGIHTTASDKTLVFTVASGKQVESKLVVVPEIRVGPFIATNVECAVAPPGDTRAARSARVLVSVSFPLPHGSDGRRSASDAD